MRKPYLWSTPVKERLQLAQQFGAHVTLLANDSPESLADTIAQGTDGHGPDVILEFSGAPTAVTSAIRLCRIGGRIVLVGSVFPTDPVTVEPEQLVRRMLTVQGVYNLQARRSRCRPRIPRQPAGYLRLRPSR